MPTQSRTIHLFVSSTFSDFKAERDLLQREVFPKLKQHCLSKGLRFQAIDLRWGVSEEAGKDNRTMRICLRELKRCQAGEIKPNFLILLGDRYGWKPLPEMIPADLFEDMEAASLAEHAELLHACYRRDDNAVPPAYFLQPRSPPWDDRRRWHDVVEPTLLSAFREAAQRLGPNPSVEQLALGDSATHREITHGALAVPDAAKHVHAFFRTIRNLPDNPPPKAFVDLDANGQRDAEASGRLDQLRDIIEGHIGRSNVHRYALDWRAGGQFTDGDIRSFADEVLASLTRVVDEQVAELETISAEEQEENAHRAFSEERRTGFIGRDEPLRRIENYLSSGPSQLLAVVGPAGSGKSALVAEVVHRAREHCTDDGVVLARFLGATPGSSDLIQLLRDLVGRIRSRYPRRPEPGTESRPGPEPREKQPNDGEIPSDINPLTNAFHEALGRATAECPLWIFLDALDQFRDANIAATLSWLPAKVPDHVHIVVSAALPTEALPTPDSPQSPIRNPRSAIEVLHRSLSRLAPGRQTIRLAPLTAADGAVLLDHWLAAARRTLDPDTQRRPILDGFGDEGNALWLRVAAEEASRWPRWQTPVSLPPRLPDLIKSVLERLSRSEEHGEVMVKRTLGYLATARHGLAEDEVIGILGADPAVMADVIARSPPERAKPEAERIKSLPVAIWVRLHGDIAFYLSERQNQAAALFGFYHRSFGEAVQGFCLPDDAARLPLHETMACWFGAQPWFLPPGTEIDASLQKPDRSNPPNTRKASELPFHLHRVAELTVGDDRWDPLVDVLCDLDCVETKARFALLYELIGDYNAALAALPEFREENERNQRHDAAMIAYNKALRDYAVVRCDWWFAKERGETRSEPPYPPLPEELRDQAERRIPEESSPRAARFRHFVNFVSGRLAPLSQAPGDALPLAHNWTDAEPVGSQAAKWILGRKSPWLKRWPRPPASPLRPQCLCVLGGHRELVRSVRVSPDSRRAVSGSQDQSVRLWDLESGMCLRILEGHRESVTSVSVSPDGRRAVSGSRDQSVRLWLFGEARKQDNGTVVAAAPGHWDDHLTCRCLHCGKIFVPSGSILEFSIQNSALIQKGLWLPESAFADPRLLAPCPHCGRALKFNPFVVDVAGDVG